MATESQKVKNLRESYDSIVNSLYLINGGGAVALLAFLAQTWEKTGFPRRSILITIAILVLGVVLSSISTFQRMLYSRKDQASEDRQIELPWHYHAVLVSSLLCFVGSMVFLIYSLGLFG